MKNVSTFSSSSVRLLMVRCLFAGSLVLGGAANALALDIIAGEVGVRAPAGPAKAQVGTITIEQIHASRNRHSNG